MAVVFISPKQRQKTFFIGITVLLLLFLATFSFGVFMSNPKEVSSALVFNKPKVNISMDIFNTDQFKNLQPLAEMEIQYSYKATQKDNTPVQGFVSATSPDEARKILESTGLTIFEIKEVQIGRDNPFTPYFQATATTAPDTTKTQTTTKTATKTTTTTK